MADSPIEQRLRREASAVKAAGPDSVDSYDPGAVRLDAGVPAGYQLHMSDEGKAMLRKEEEPSVIPKMSKGMGGSQRPSLEQRARVTPQSAAPQRALSAEELMALANTMQSRIAAETAAIPNQPNAVQMAQQQSSPPPLWLSHYMSQK